MTPPLRFGRLRSCRSRDRRGLRGLLRGNLRLWGRGCAACQRVVLLFGLGDPGDGLAHLHRLSGRFQNMEVSAVDALIFNGILLVFILHDGVALLNQGALRDPPLADGALHHGQSGLWHWDINTHRFSSPPECRVSPT